MTGLAHLLRFELRFYLRRISTWVYFAVLAFLLLAVRSGLFPVGGMVSLDFESLGFWGKTKDLLHHLPTR